MSPLSPRLTLSESQNVSCPAHQFATPDALHRTPIGIVLFNGFALSELSRLVDALQPADAETQTADAADTADADLTPRDIVLFSAAGGRIASATSVFVWTERIDATRSKSDYRAFFIMSGTGLQRALKDTRLVTWFQRAQSRGERLVATAKTLEQLCAAGVIERSSAEAVADAAGHTWVDSRDLADAARALIDEECGATSPTLADSSDTYADKTRPSPPDLPALASIANDKITTAIRWLEAHFDKPMSIRDAAQAAAMSERNFLRRFKAATNFTPSEYVLNLRIEAICRLLAETDLPVEKIARRCGIANGAGLSKLFRQHFQLTPTEYRRQFAVTREAGEFGDASAPRAQSAMPARQRRSGHLAL